MTVCSCAGRRAYGLCYKIAACEFELARLTMNVVPADALARAAFAPAASARAAPVFAVVPADVLLTAPALAVVPVDACLEAARAAARTRAAFARARICTKDIEAALAVVPVDAPARAASARAAAPSRRLCPRSSSVASIFCVEDEAEWAMITTSRAESEAEAEANALSSESSKGANGGWSIAAVFGGDEHDAEWPKHLLCLETRQVSAQRHRTQHDGV